MSRGRGALAVGLALVGAGALAGCQSATPHVTPMAAAHAPACLDATFPIYFAQGSDQLTPTAVQVIASQASLLHGCRIGYVNVLGLTDAHGTSAQNLDLSRRRAATVAQALAANGLPAPKFEVNGLGESGALTDSGHPVPLHRKTEVIIHALPPG